MFNIVEKNQKFVKVIMITVAATFVLWGIGGYLGMSSNDGYVAQIGDKKIYPKDVENLMTQNKQLTDKTQALLALINRQLLINNTYDNYMSVNQEQLQNEIASVPLFLENGSFSLKKYQEFLRTQQVSPTRLQENAKEQLLIRQTVDFFKDSYFTSYVFNQELAKLLSRERVVMEYKINPSKFYSQINVTDKQINDYYKENIKQLTTPEQVRVEFLQLNPQAIEKTIKIEPSQLASYIKDHKDELNNTQVDVSHILFSVTNLQQKDKVRAQATKVLNEILAKPNDFALFAKRYSNDTVSAKKGGDLGFFAHNVMEKPFEDAAFKLKINQISSLVETKFGFHILKLNKIKTNSQAEIENLALEKLKKQQSNLILQKQVEKLNDTTYNNPQTLEIAAKNLGLTIQNSSWITKNDATGEFANPKVQKAIFSDEVIGKHNNSEVVELGNNNYAVYRMVEYKKSETKLLAQVRAQIIETIKKNTARTLASNEGNNLIKQLNSKKINLAFTNSQKINLLSQNPNITVNTVKQIFATKLNNFTGEINKNNEFVIYKAIEDTINPKLVLQNTTSLKQLGDSSSLIDLNIYIEYLKNKYKVNYKLEGNKS